MKENEVKEAIKHLSLLVIDDDSLFRNMVARMLKKSWRTVGLAYNVESGIEAIQTGAYDIVLCDWDMPDGTGGDVCKSTSVPIVICTGSGQNYFDIGDIPIIRKPADLEVINRTLYSAYRAGEREG